MGLRWGEIGCGGGAEDFFQAGCVGRAGCKAEQRWCLRCGFFVDTNHIGTELVQELATHLKLDALAVEKLIATIFQLAQLGHGDGGCAGKFVEIEASRCAKIFEQSAVFC